MMRLVVSEGGRKLRANGQQASTARVICKTDFIIYQQSVRTDGLQDVEAGDQGGSRVRLLSSPHRSGGGIGGEQHPRNLRANKDQSQCLLPGPQQQTVFQAAQGRLAHDHLAHPLRPNRALRTPRAPHRLCLIFPLQQSENHHISSQHSAHRPVAGVLGSSCCQEKSFTVCSSPKRRQIWNREGFSAQLRRKQLRWNSRPILPFLCTLVSSKVSPVRIVLSPTAESMRHRYLCFSDELSLSQSPSSTKPQLLQQRYLLESPTCMRKSTPVRSSPSSAGRSARLNCRKVGVQCSQSCPLRVHRESPDCSCRWQGVPSSTGCGTGWLTVSDSSLVFSAGSVQEEVMQMYLRLISQLVKLVMSAAVWWQQPLSSLSGKNSRCTRSPWLYRGWQQLSSLFWKEPFPKRILLFMPQAFQRWTAKRCSWPQNQQVILGRIQKRSSARWKLSWGSCQLKSVVLPIVFSKTEKRG